MTTEDALRKVAGILSHPVFTGPRKDVVMYPGPDSTVIIGGPRTHLDGFSAALTNSGMRVFRPAPATLVVVF